MESAIEQLSRELGIQPVILKQIFDRMIGQHYGNLSAKSEEKFLHQRKSELSKKSAGI